MKRSIHARRAVSLAATLLLASCSSGGEAPAGPARTTTTRNAEARPLAAELDALSVSTGGRPRIVDAAGRTVILRGANLNSLGDYYQDDPELTPVRPPTDDDWDTMAAHGFSVVRLIVHWSKLEPTRGEFNEAYLAQIRAAVEAAGSRGIYTVIDFHQDAWGKFIASPPDVRCDDGDEPAIGWDGAPEWATLTEGADTCRPPGLREGAPAVATAFRNFYRNTGGIRDRYIATVAEVAGRFADEPMVAGYDLMNEPNLVLPAEESSARYTELLNGLIAGIRDAERDAGGFPHLIFLEPIVLYPLGGTMPTTDLTGDPNIVFAPHNYAEVIGKVLTVEQTFDISAATADDRGWPLWIGEYGVFSQDPEALAIATRFAAAEDDHLAAGSAEWQWRQLCGEPHSVSRVGAVSTSRQVHLNLTDCPGDVDAGPNEDLLRIVGRAYPLRAPGDLTRVSSDPATGMFEVEGRAGADRRDELVVWVPGSRPAPEVEGLGPVTMTEVEGGWYLSGTPTASSYRLRLDGS